MAGPIQLNVRGANLSGLAALQNGSNRLMNQGADRIQQAIAGYGKSLNNAATGRINDAISSLDPNLSQGDRTTQIAALKQDLGGMGGYNSKAVNEFQESVNPFSLDNKLKATRGESAALTLKGQREQDESLSRRNTMAQRMNEFTDANGVLNSDAMRDSFMAQPGATPQGWNTLQGEMNVLTGQDQVNAAASIDSERQFQMNKQQQLINGRAQAAQIRAGASRDIANTRAGASLKAAEAKAKSSYKSGGKANLEATIAREAEDVWNFTGIGNDLENQGELRNIIAEGKALGMDDHTISNIADQFYNGQRHDLASIRGAIDEVRATQDSTIGTDKPLRSRGANKLVTASRKARRERNR